jgi:hypothetical protein
MLVIRSIFTTVTFIATVYGFEYRPPTHDFKRFSTGNITAATATSSANSQLKNNEDYCLVFEDHFNTFDLKNWQVLKYNLYYVINVIPNIICTSTA